LASGLLGQLRHPEGASADDTEGEDQGGFVAEDAEGFDGGAAFGAVGFLGFGDGGAFVEGGRGLFGEFFEVLDGGFAEENAQFEAFGDAVGEEGFDLEVDGIAGLHAMDVGRFEDEGEEFGSVVFGANDLVHFWSLSSRFSG